MRIFPLNPNKSAPAPAGAFLLHGKSSSLAMSSLVSSRLRQHGKKNNKQRAVSRLPPESSSKVRRGIKQPGAAGSSRLLQRSSRKKNNSQPPGSSRQPGIEPRAASRSLRKK